MREFRAVRRILNLDTRATAILLGSKKSVEALSVRECKLIRFRYLEKKRDISFTNVIKRD